MSRALNRVVAAALIALALASSPAIPIPWRAALLHATAIAVVDSGNAHEAAHSVTNAVTTGITTTSATLLVACVSSFTGNAEPTYDDSNHNTWRTLTTYSNGPGQMRVRILYAYDKAGSALSLGSSNTFSATGTSVYASITWAAFSGTDTTSAVYNSDVTGLNDYSVSNSAPMNPGSLTVASGDLGISCEGTPFSALSTTYTATDGSYAILDQYHVSGVTEGSGLQWFYNSGASSSHNPGWDSVQSNISGAASHATFKGTGGSGGSVVCTRSLMGVGCVAPH